MSQGEAETPTWDPEAWEPVGARKVRSRTETNRIVTLTGDALEASCFEDGTEVSLFVRGGEIILWRWDAGIPDVAVIPSHADEEDGVGTGIFLPAGVREVHSSGTSIIVTLTDRALTEAGFDTGQPLQEWAREDGLKLTAEGPDVEAAA